MMKNRVLCSVLAAMLALAMCIPALADSAAPQMAFRVGDLTLFIGQDHLIYESDSSAAVSGTAASALVYADGSKLIFVSEDGTELLETVMDAAEGEAPKKLADIASVATYVPHDGMIYFLSGNTEDETTLMAINPVTGGTEDKLMESAHHLIPIATLGGLVLETIGDDESFDLAAKNFTQLAKVALGTEVQIFGNFQTLLTFDGKLSLGAAGQSIEDAIAVDTDVLASTMVGAKVYYAKKDGETTTIHVYDYASKQNDIINTLEKIALVPTMVAGAGKIYVLGFDPLSVNTGDINDEDASNGASTTAYALDVDTRVLNSLDEVGVIYGAHMFADSKQLLVYGSVGGSSAETLVKQIPLGMDDIPMIEPVVPEEAEDDAPVATVKAAPSDAEIASATEKAEEEAKKPAVPVSTTLVRGSRGNEVKELQEILIKHRYPIKHADGIYGSATSDAVKYLQYDLGRRETGEVTRDFLNHLKHSCPEYHVYVEMRHGDNGIRVYDLQVRLRSLGYMSVGANGNFGTKTEAAVKEFQKAVKKSETGVASAALVEEIFSKNAPKANNGPKPPKRAHKISDDDEIMLTRHFNLTFNKAYSTAKCVKLVQKRLHTLSLLNKSHISGVYDNHTVKAVKKFQELYNGNLPHNGKPTSATLNALFPNGI